MTKYIAGHNNLRFSQVRVPPRIKVCVESANLIFLALFPPTVFFITNLQLTLSQWCHCWAILSGSKIVFY